MSETENHSFPFKIEGSDSNTLVSVPDSSTENVDSNAADSSSSVASSDRPNQLPPLKLKQSLNGTIPVKHAETKLGDNAPEPVNDADAATGKRPGKYIRVGRLAAEAGANTQSAEAPKGAKTTGSGISEATQNRRSAVEQHRESVDEKEAKMSLEERFRIAVPAIEDTVTDDLVTLLDNENLSIYIVTWNMHGKLPPLDVVRELVPPPGQFHLIVIGTQECERGIGASLVFPSKANWETVLTVAVGREYSLIGATSLGSMHLAVFVWIPALPLVSSVCAGEVATGIANMVGNKGGTAIGFRVGITRLLFINSHLAAHTQFLERRNQDFVRIRTDLAPILAAATGAKGPLEAQYDTVFWLGDLNYRIVGARTLIEHLVTRTTLFEVLVAHDQLKQVQQTGAAFRGYLEGPLAFAPTYKYDDNADLYDTSTKQRVPAWTDRILFTPSPGVVLRRYTALQNVRFSDHRPVVASFAVSFHGTSAGGSEEASKTCTML